MIEIRYTESFQKKIQKLKAKQPTLNTTLKKKFHLFAQNPRHSGLRLHKLRGKRSSQLAIWIEGDLRALAIKDGQTYIFFDVITHDQY